MKKTPDDVIPSVTWAFGPPMDMKVTPACHSERAKPRTVWCRAKRGICFLSSSRNSRFLVATLLGITEWLDDFRRSEARDLLFVCFQQETARRGGPRCARHGRELYGERY